MYNKHRVYMHTYIIRVYVHIVTVLHSVACFVNILHTSVEFTFGSSSRWLPLL